MSGAQFGGAVFVTGTDTGVGKTRVAAALLARARLLGLSTAGLKPVASGCEEIDGVLRNEDALALQAQTTLALSYEQINPVALKEAIAPHIAAQHQGRNLSVSRLEGLCRGVLMQRPGFCVVEGAGGWRVPLNHREFFSDLAQRLQLPVVLVVGIRLGCINHAVLTAEAIRHDGLPLVGWVANHLAADTPSAQDNVASLRELIGSPCLGELPFDPDAGPEQVARLLNFPSADPLG